MVLNLIGDGGFWIEETLGRERNLSVVGQIWFHPSLLHAGQILSGLFSGNELQSTTHVRIQAFHTYPFQSQWEEAGGNSIYVRQPWVCHLWALISKVGSFKMRFAVGSLSLCKNQREWHFDAIICSLLTEQTCATDRSKWVTWRDLVDLSAQEIVRFVCDQFGVFEGRHCLDWLAGL